jgi:hypothetical protein
MQKAIIIYGTFAETAPNCGKYLRSTKDVHTYDVVRIEPAVTALLEEFRYG